MKLIKYRIKLGLHSHPTAFFNYLLRSHLRLIYFVLLINISHFTTVECQHQHNSNLKTSSNQYENSISDTNPQEHKSDVEGCIKIDGICLLPADIASYEAIKSLHAHLDDDQSGDIDLSESVDFLREELNYTKGFERRQKAFHHNDDQHISVQELWSNWLSNEVHNWTVEQAVAWLSSSVELGQYAEVFYENAINGSMLPRLATNNEQYLTRILGIKNPTHRSKIGIKAMDIVLFGPPKGSLVKDVFIGSLLAFITVLLYKFMTMRSRNEVIFKKMDQDMEALQGELMKFHEEKKHQSIKKVDEDSKVDCGTTDEPTHESEQYEDENIWEDKYERHNLCWSATDLDVVSKNKLELWLQLTYEREKIAFNNKVEDTKRQLTEARERYDNMKPNKKNFFGALSFIHGNIESKGQPISEAQRAIEEIKRMNEEMKFRWHAIEDLLEMEIMKNHGLAKLELILEPNLQKLTRASNAAIGIVSSSDVVRGSTRSIASDTFRTSSVSSRSTVSDSIKGSSISSRSIASESLKGNLATSRSVRSTASEEDGSRKRPPFVRSNTRSSMFSDSESDFGPASLATQKHHLGGSVRFASPSRLIPSQSNSIQQSHTVGSGLDNYAAADAHMVRSSSFDKVRKRSFDSCHPHQQMGHDVGINNSSNEDSEHPSFTVGNYSEIQIGKQSLKPKISSSSTLRGSQNTLQGSRENVLADLSSLRPSSNKTASRIVSEQSLDVPDSDSGLSKEGSPISSKKSFSSKSKNIFSRIGLRGKSEKGSKKLEHM